MNFPEVKEEGSLFPKRGGRGGRGERMAREREGPASGLSILVRGAGRKVRAHGLSDRAAFFGLGRHVS